MGYLSGYLEVHGETQMRIHVHTVSYDMLTLVIVNRSRSFEGFTCFGVIGLGRLFYDLLLIKLI